MMRKECCRNRHAERPMGEVPIRGGEGSLSRHAVVRPTVLRPGARVGDSGKSGISRAAVRAAGNDRGRADAGAEGRAVNILLRAAP